MHGTSTIIFKKLAEYTCFSIFSLKPQVGTQKYNLFDVSFTKPALEKINNQ